MVGSRFEKVSTLWLTTGQPREALVSLTQIFHHIPTWTLQTLPPEFPLTAPFVDDMATAPGRHVYFWSFSLGLMGLNVATICFSGDANGPFFVAGVG